MTGWLLKVRSVKRGQALEGPGAKSPAKSRLTPDSWYPCGKNDLGKGCSRAEAWSSPASEAARATPRVESSDLLPEFEVSPV